MNDEEAFQAALDADPNDRTARLVFADWLEERGDPRADGYRAIARLPVCDCRDNKSHTGRFLWMKASWAPTSDGFAILPDAWVDLLEGGFQCYTEGPAVEEDSYALGKWRDYHSRREAEDTAALAFAKLPSERRAELLVGKK
jgi:uncharacterized protein (TIGR02996 family)